MQATAASLGTVAASIASYQVDGGQVQTPPTLQPATAPGQIGRRLLSSPLSDLPAIWTIPDDSQLLPWLGLDNLQHKFSGSNSSNTGLAADMRQVLLSRRLLQSPATGNSGGSGSSTVDVTMSLTSTSGAQLQLLISALGQELGQMMTAQGTLFSV